MAPEKITLRLRPDESQALLVSSLQNLRTPTKEAQALLRVALGLANNELVNRIAELEKRIANLEAQIEDN